MAVTIDGTTGVSLVQDGVITDANLPAGSVLQVVSATKTDTFASSSTNGSYDVTGLSVSITPSSTSSKVLVLSQINYDVNSTSRGGFLLTRDSTNVFIADSSGSRDRQTVCVNGNGRGNNLNGTANITYLDSPSSTSALTYKIRADVRDSAAIFVNRSYGNSDAATVCVGTSSITVMEIAG